MQNRFYGDTGYDAALRAACRGRGVVYQSFWTLTGNPEMLAHPTLLRVAAAHGVTPACAWLRFVMHLGVVPLVGCASAAHMAEDVALTRMALSLREVLMLGELIGEGDIVALRDSV